MGLRSGRRCRRRAARRLVAVAAGALGLMLASAPSAGAADVGVQSHVLWSEFSTSPFDITRTGMHRQLNVAMIAGARYLRVDLGWATLEPERDGEWNDWYVSRIDELVDAANQRGLRLIFTVWSTPCWASSAPRAVRQGCAGAWWERGVQRYPPRDPGEYADALRFLVKRYRGDVAAWEVWNEPDLDEFFRTSDPAEEYAGLLRAGHRAAKRAHPGSTVLGGSLSGADYEFTRALFRHGVRNHFDGWAIHPYSGDRSPLDTTHGTENSFVRGIPAVRRVLVEEGDPEPLWLTEFGWSTCTVRNSGESWRNCVDERTQAEYLRLAYEQMEEWNYVDVGIWFNLQDWGRDPAERVFHYGLLDYDGNPKLSYTAFTAAAGGGRASP
jgi:hypothetical protein